ncbi:MAG: HAD hydrolase-like protein, partial [Aliifodinibius sp.]|nr:HAD hydrolase-like protein [Fodinibius sp.]
MKRMQAIFFDFDGVVIRSMEDHYEGWRKALQEYGIEMNPEELYVMEGTAIEEIANQFTRKFNIPFEEASNIIQKKHRYYEELKKEEFYPYLIKVLEWAKEKGLRTALVTGGERDRVMEALDNFGLK